MTHHPIIPGSAESTPEHTGQRPRPYYQWTNGEVIKWFQRHCPEYDYGELFRQHDVTGRALVQMNEFSLQRLGITDSQHRRKIWREILKLRLKTDMYEMKEMETKSSRVGTAGHGTQTALD
ncbi:unnamed protein product [Cyprideis torosa]|uniref:Uncharacterized protein n=1 Tax=Cyprideis torosa TaxID=163714 RepID=A0A7R8ZQX8_9CRUS|nr:unnamed protein product [Cyprideis torosa]CAG0897475.1 unnamed protein product [Cyprideis torosa]